MRVITLAIKDLSQIIRDKKTVIYLLLMPLAFTLFFGFIFSSPKVADNRLPLGVINQDQGGTLSQNLLEALGKSDTIRIEAMPDSKLDQAARLLHDKKLAGVLLIPATFSRRGLAGDEPELTLITDSETQTGQMVANLLTVTTGRLLSELRIAHLSAEALASQVPFASVSARQIYLEQGLNLASQGWEQPALTVQEERATGAGQPKSPAPDVYLQSSPGMIVQFTIYGLMTAAMVLVLERKTRTLQRLLTTPLSKVEIIAGKVLAMVVMVFVQQAILVLLGQFAFGVNYLREPLAILVMMLALALWAASLGLFIGAISKGEEQVILWTLMAMFIFSALGGAWFTLEGTGKAFNTIGHLTPAAWAMDGFQNIIARGLGFSSILLPAGLLLGYAVLFFGLAVWRFRFD